jgi:hypothetical protein
MFRNRGRVGHVDAVDAYQFPSSVRQRFTHQHHSLTGDDIQTVEAATRQWFRVAAGHPKAKLWMPSVVVDDLWHELVLHTRDYAAFCDAAFGRFLHHVPDSAMTTAAAARRRDTALLATLRLAQQDERCDPSRLPLLFRVDQELAVPGGRRYLADCGGRGDCYELAGTLCLQHLRGFGQPTRGDSNPNHIPNGGMHALGGGGCGGGCGGGGCGGG